MIFSLLLVISNLVFDIMIAIQVNTPLIYAILIIKEISTLIFSIATTKGIYTENKKVE